MDFSYKNLPQSLCKTSNNFSVQLSTPNWRFSYVDTIAQLSSPAVFYPSSSDSMIDVIGQSTIVMPSTRVYRSSSRFRLIFREDLILFEMLYDTVMTYGEETWRSVWESSSKFNVIKYSLIFSYFDISQIS